MMNGVKRGCVLPPTLFSTVFSTMLTYAFHDCQVGIPVRYRTNGGLFNLRRMKAVPKVKETVIRVFFFADDCALNASTEQRMWHEMHCLLKAVTTLVLPSAPKRLKSCISLHLESLTRNHTLRLRGKTYRQLTTSPNWVVHPMEWCTSMLKSTTGWLRPAAPSEASVRMSGSGGTSASLLS